MLFADGSVALGDAVLHGGAQWQSLRAVPLAAGDGIASTMCVALAAVECEKKEMQCAAFFVTGDAGNASLARLLIVRTDTMALLWSAEMAEEARGGHIEQVVLLSSNAVCGLLRCDGKPRMFAAMRATARKAKDRVQSVQARLVPDAAYVALASAGKPRTALALTTDGALHAVTFGEKAADIASPRKKKLTAVDLAGNDGVVRICVSPIDDELQCVAVYGEGSSRIELVAVSYAGGNATCIARTTVKCCMPVVRIDAAGPLHFAIVAHGADAVIVLAYNVSVDERRIEHRLSAPLRSAFPLLGAGYDAHTGACIVYGSSVPMTTWVMLSGEAQMRAVVCRTLPSAVLQNVAEADNTTPTVMLSEWLRATHVDGVQGNAADADETVLTSLGLRGSVLSATSDADARHTAGSVTLCYALAGDEFAMAVSAAAHVHTRLVKQWPRASAGLRQLLLSDDKAVSKHALTLSWNPRHMRRALRSMTQGELCSVFRRLADTLRQGDQLYSTLATATVDTALLLITLSRSMGVELPLRDVQTVAALLRASRAAGHDLYGYTSRMELLARSFVQRRAVRQLLRRGAARMHLADDTVVSLEHDFRGVAKDIDLQRSVQTRYTMNGWAERAAAQATHHRAVAAFATAFLTQAHSASAASPPVSLSQWEVMGREHYPDAVFDEFESTLTR